MRTEAGKILKGRIANIRRLIANFAGGRKAGLVVLEDFVELAPGAKIGGHCKIGSYTFVGMNAIILPKVKIGKNVVVASGAVVTKDVLDNCMVAGVPAVIKNEREPLPF